VDTLWSNPVENSCHPALDTQPTQNRSLARAGIVLFVGSLLVFLVAILLDRDRFTLLDLQVYRWGGSTAFSSDALYSSRFDDHLPFTYPPIAAIFFTPLSWIPLEALKWLSILANALLVPALGWVAVSAMARQRGHRIAREQQIALVGTASAILLFVEPVQQTIWFGQINLFLAVVVLADLCLPDTSRWKGVGVGIASAVKLTPLIFVAYLLWSGRIRATVVALATFVGMMGVGFVALPRESRSFWIDRLFLDSDRVGGISYISNQSIHGVAARVLGGADQASTLWLASALVVGLIGFASAVVAARQGREVLGVLLCALTGLMVSPISWSHHWVWIVPFSTAALYSLAFRVSSSLVSRVRQLLVSPVNVLIALGVIATIGIAIRPSLRRFGFWFAPNSEGQWYTWTFWQAMYGNAYVLAGLLGVVAGAVMVGRATTITKR
jgi:alpha-1,2-mannosyltransferase